MRLIRIALLTAALAFAATGSAMAQYELTWDKCPGSYGAVINKMFACDDAAQPMVLVTAFTPPQGLPRFAGLSFELEITSAAGDLPDWWRAGIGDCREGAMTTINSPGNTLGQCQNPWLGSPTGGGSQYEANYYGSGRSRFSMVYAREKATGLVAGTRYYGGSITIDATGTSSGCSGCATPVCIAIRQVIIAQERAPQDGPDQEPRPGDQINLTNSSGTNVVTFNVRDGNGCGSKSRNRTWGQVKAIYRR
jgi:hypothetical protein